MYRIFAKPPNQIVVGTYLITVTVISWTGMHVAFFGVPRFTSFSEIGYTLASLGVIGIGSYSIVQGIRERR